MISTKKYDIIYSLGSNCACALYLNKNNQRSTSGPFDWICGISFKDRINLILNDFNSWLDINNLSKLPEQIKTEKNQRYKDESNGCIFPHDFPINQSLEEALPLVKEKYTRRINRFYNNLNYKEKSLLIWFSLDTKLSNSEIEWASNELNKKFNKQIDIVIIEHDDDLINKEPIVNQITPSSCKISLFGKNINDTAEFTKGNMNIFLGFFERVILKYFWGR